jgi:hypothetical protein
LLLQFQMMMSFSSFIIWAKIVEWNCKVDTIIICQEFIFLKTIFIVACLIYGIPNDDGIIANFYLCYGMLNFHDNFC